MPDLAREHGIAENIISCWKSKFGGMEFLEAKRLRELEQQNQKLKRQLAEAELDTAAMKEVLRESGGDSPAVPRHGAPEEPPSQRTTSLSCSQV